MSGHLSKADGHLYNVPAPKRAKREIATSTSLAFSSQLSSLISSRPSGSAEPVRGRAGPASKADIFKSHNKGTKKRAAQDDEDPSRHKVGARPLNEEESALLRQGRSKMEEKAKLYAAMKRGDYVAGEHEPEQLVDFDRKWAENEERGAGNELEVYSSSEDEWTARDQDEIVDYVDEFGRARTGTRAEMERMERRRRNQLLGAEELDRMSARPVMPSQVIYGDVVQSAAFNPDEEVAEKMEEIARKRDRSMTPPEAKHYEADTEIRSRGTGFFAFSKDEQTRTKEMAALAEERQETERMRRQAEEAKDGRRRKLEERRRQVAAARAAKQADCFLDDLESSMGGHDRQDGGQQSPGSSRVDVAADEPR
jgi:hypothetical protein